MEQILERDTVAKGFENIAISQEKQDSIYRLALLPKFKHPKLVVVWRLTSVKKGRSEQNTYKREKTYKYHYLSGKVNYTRIARALGISVYTVIRYLKCQHKKSRQPGGFYHENYLESVESGRYAKQKKGFKADRKLNPEKWAKMQKNWLDKNKEKKAGYDRKQYEKNHPLSEFTCLFCGDLFSTRDKRKSLQSYCSKKECRSRFWADYAKKWRIDKGLQGGNNEQALRC